MQLDLSDPAETINAVGEIQEKLGGRLDALVNNAGISPKGPNGERLARWKPTFWIGPKCSM